MNTVVRFIVKLIPYSWISFFTKKGALQIETSPYMTADYLPHFDLLPGDKVPDFITTTQDGTEVQISKMPSDWIVLFFYPEDDTPTCTKEACNIRDHYSILKSKGILIYGISPNNHSSHHKFISKFQLPYDLLVDEDHKIASLYKVWSLKKFMGRVYEGIHRSTFIINKEKNLHQIIYPVDSANHTQQILKSIFPDTQL